MVGKYSRLNCGANGHLQIRRTVISWSTLGANPFLKARGGPGAGGKASAWLPDGYSALPHPRGGGPFAIRKGLDGALVFIVGDELRGRHSAPVIPMCLRSENPQ